MISSTTLYTCFYLTPYNELLLCFNLQIIIHNRDKIKQIYTHFAWMMTLHYSYYWPKLRNIYPVWFAQILFEMLIYHIYWSEASHINLYTYEWHIFLHYWYANHLILFDKNMISTVNWVINSNELLLSTSKVVTVHNMQNKLPMIKTNKKYYILNLDIHA